jgi:hypothetical protein
VVLWSPPKAAAAAAAPRAPPPPVEEECPICFAPWATTPCAYRFACKCRAVAFCEACIYSLAGLPAPGSGSGSACAGGGGGGAAHGACPLCRVPVHGTQIAYAPHPLRLPLPATALPAPLLPRVPAPALHVGSVVRVRAGVVPRYGWGRVAPSSMGRVVGIEPRAAGSEAVVRINFPEQANWAGLGGELEVLLQQ